MGINERQNLILQDFANCGSWEERYKKIIALGKILPAMDEKFKTDENLIRGCQSQVWLHANLDEKGLVTFQADSDALIVKGLVSILIQVFSNSSPDEILSSSLDFLKELGFEQNLSPSRANGLFAMIKQMRYYATAFKVLQLRKG